MKLTKTDVLEIPLSKGFVALVDADMFDELSSFRWSLRQNHGNNYARAWSAGANILMHRVVMRAKKGQIVDHINRNGLDNRRSNLRFVTSLQNLMNSRPKSKHGYKGLSLDNRRDAKPWQAIARVNGRPKSLGYYATREEAALAYDRMMIKLYGEYAYLNFPALSKETGE
jgi:hypothetical protein